MNNNSQLLIMAVDNINKHYKITILSLISGNNQQHYKMGKILSRTRNKLGIKKYFTAKAEEKSLFFVDIIGDKYVN